MNLAERFEHLALPFVPKEFFREKKSRGFGYKKVERDKNEFLQAEIQEFENIQQKYITQKKRYSEYLDPNLIFKININQKVSEDTFRSELKRIGVEVISPSPDKKGYWIVFTEDEEFLEFKKKLKEYVSKDKYDFFYAIEKILDIPPEEKIGENLKKEPFKDNENSYLDIEIWRMEDNKLDIFLSGFQSLIDNKEGKIVDVLTTKNFCLLRVKVNKKLYEDILDLREVARVDRPPKIKLETALYQDIEELKIEGMPNDNTSGILVVDSGILSSHPFLENAVGDEIAVATKNSKEISEDEPYDDIGHGTQVAGIALYGDVQKCIENKVFNPEVWIFSAKVMFKDDSGNATYDTEELLEHQLDEAVRRIVSNYPNCKVINLSLGDSAKRMHVGRRQFSLASLIDELSKELNVIFVISAGNNDFDVFDNYPEYLLDESTDRVKIIDPATSALALTVGALSKHTTLNPFFDTFEEYPSPITRVGLGYKGMIKPELVENGGGGFGGEESDVITINPNWIKEGRLFTLVSGTSFSTPKISNYIARLINKYPDRSTNLIKALLLSSTSIPPNRPEPLSKISMDASDKNAIDLLKVYGYGKPNFEKALFSESNRVVLIRENTIKLNQIQVYPINLPKEFVEVSGDRNITVTLVFDPPINSNRADYLGTTFETHLFRNLAIENVLKSYISVPKNIMETEEEVVPENLKKNEIKLHPGINLRKKGVHHKGIKEYRRSPDIDVNVPLVLVVICQDKWIKDENYSQKYAVVVAIEHSKKIDLYNQIRLKNQRISISLGA